MICITEKEVSITFWLKPLLLKKPVNMRFPNTLKTTKKDAIFAGL